MISSGLLWVTGFYPSLGIWFPRCIMSDDGFMTQDELEDWIDELDDYIFDYLLDKDGVEPDEDFSYSLANAMACLIDHNATDGLEPTDLDGIAAVINDELVESTAKALVPEKLQIISEIFGAILAADEE